MAEGAGSVSGMVAAAVLYVKSLGLMTAFYEKCLGMSVVEAAEGDFAVLTGGGWELSLVLVPPAVAAAIVVTDPPVRRANTPVKLAFEVAGIEGLRPVVAGRAPWLTRPGRPGSSGDTGWSTPSTRKAMSCSCGSEWRGRD